MLVEFEKKNFIGGIFFKLGAMGANVLVEFENVFLIGGIFFTIGGIFFKLGAMVENVYLGHSCLQFCPNLDWWQILLIGDIFISYICVFFVKS